MHFVAIIFKFKIFQRYIMPHTSMEVSNVKSVSFRLQRKFHWNSIKNSFDAFFRTSQQRILVLNINAKFARLSSHLATIWVKFTRPNSLVIVSMKVYISERHMSVHTIGDVECKICIIRFTKQSLELHVKKAHPDLTYDDVFGDVSQKSEINEKVTFTESIFFFMA